MTAGQLGAPEFSVLGARVEPHAAVPTLMLRIGVAEPARRRVHALALRCQIRVEPAQRRYSAEEAGRLYELFGETAQWGDSLRPFLWTHVSTVLTGFDGETEIELPVACSYDLEVAATKYMHGIGEGDIPLTLLFSGTVFAPGQNGLVAEPVSWDREARFRLPVALWREMMDRYFPNSGWLRVQRETIDELMRFKVERGLLTVDQALEQLLKEAAAEPSPPADVLGPSGLGPSGLGPSGLGPSGLGLSGLGPSGPATARHDSKAGGTLP
jgi:hypothetical protein